MRKLTLSLLLFCSFVTFGQTKHVYIVKSVNIYTAPVGYDSLNYICSTMVTCADSTEKYPQFYYKTTQNVIFADTCSQKTIFKIIGDSANFYVKRTFPKYTN